MTQKRMFEIFGVVKKTKESTLIYVNAATEDEALKEANEFAIDLSLTGKSWELGLGWRDSPGREQEAPSFMAGSMSSD